MPFCRDNLLSHFLWLVSGGGWRIRNSFLTGYLNHNRLSIHPSLSSRSGSSSTFTQCFANCLCGEITRKYEWFMYYMADVIILQLLSDSNSKRASKKMRIIANISLIFSDMWVSHAVICTHHFGKGSARTSTWPDNLKSFFFQMYFVIFLSAYFYSFFTVPW